MTASDTATFWIEYVIRNGGIALRSPAKDLNWGQIHHFDLFAIIFVLILVFSILLYISYKFITSLCLSSKQPSPTSEMNRDTRSASPMYEDASPSQYRGNTPLASPMSEDAGPSQGRGNTPSASQMSTDTSSSLSRRKIRSDSQMSTDTSSSSESRLLSGMSPN